MASAMSPRNETQEIPPPPKTVLRFNTALIAIISPSLQRKQGTALRLYSFINKFEALIVFCTVSSRNRSMKD
jgi:hypothetical protein